LNSRSDVILPHKKFTWADLGGINTDIHAVATPLLLTYYTAGWGSIKPAIYPKRLKIERKLLLTVCIKSYTGFDCRQNVRA